MPGRKPIRRPVSSSGPADFPICHNKFGAHLTKTPIRRHAGTFLLPGNKPAQTLLIYAPFEANGSDETKRDVLFTRFAKPSSHAPTI